jgi:hypothetical protein
MVTIGFTRRTALPWSARAVALASVYFIVAEIGLRYSSIGVSVSPVWPPRRGSAPLPASPRDLPRS